MRFIDGKKCIAGWKELAAHSQKMEEVEIHHCCD